MDALLKVALAGTARAQAAAVEAATPADALVAGLPGGEPERQLLLMAGARAVYRQAGWVAPAVADTPEPAPAERLPACSPGAARLIADMLAGQHAELLPEALDRLRRAGRRLPPGLLPAALDAGTRKADLRPALLPVIGERGRWLAAHNQWWAWAKQLPLDAAGDAPPPDAEAIWQEGAPEERLAILRRVRAVDPARGREWLADVWRQEKADFRTKAVEALATGLSPEDEPFLEAALDDRSQGVRAEAAKLLARLPGSALVARMRERADAMLAYEPPVPVTGLRRLAGALTGQQGVGRLVVMPAQEIDKAWQRDGIEAQPPYRIGERSWWLMRALSHVAPAHWTERFGAGPQELIAAAERDEWALPVLEGWARAAVLHGDAAWVSPLWDWWSRRAGDQSDAAHSRAVFQELRFSLSRCLGGSETERLVLRLAPRSSDSSHKAWEGVLLTLQALPPPWGAELGHRYLDALRDHARKGLRAAGTTADPWLRSLEFARWGLPPDCFERALEPWSLPEPQPGAWLLGMWHQQVDRFTETIRVRRRVMEEIPL